MKNIKVLLLILIVSLSVLAACSGERTITSNNVERIYYLKLPENYNYRTQYPLIFAFHGATGDYTSFTEGYYDLQSVVGEEAILSVPKRACKRSRPDTME